MRKHQLTLLVVAFVFFAGSAFALDYNGALLTAKKDNKPLMLYFFSKTCFYCVAMEKTTLADKDIQGTLKGDFVVAWIDTDDDTKLAQLYSIRGTPTTWFLDSSGKRISEVPGYVQKERFQKVLEYVKGKHYAGMDLLTYLKKTAAKK